MNTRTITCDICGKAFNTTNKNVKYCCLECQAIGKSYTRRLWMEERADYMAGYMREYRKRQSAGTT